MRGSAVARESMLEAACVGTVGEGRGWGPGAGCGGGGGVVFSGERRQGVVLWGVETWVGGGGVSGSGWGEVVREAPAG